MVFTPVSKPQPDYLQRQSSSIHRRRALEAQRKPIIFDAKVRTIGVDVNALDGQVAERHNAEDNEKQRDLQFDLAAIDIAKQLTHLQRIKQRKVHERNVQVQKYREQYQQFTETRDYDLNDPLSLRKGCPPRVNDIDQLHASSLQMFSGEDLHKRDRVRQQQREVTQWANQSRQQKEKVERQHEEDEKAFADEVARIDDELERLQRLKQTNVRRHNIEVQYYNEELDHIVKQSRHENDQHNEELGQMELKHNADSLWLNEDYSTTRRHDHPQHYISSSHCYIPSNFKGYSVEERQAILNEQAAQIEEKQQRKAREQVQKQLQDQEMAAINRQLMLSCRIRQRNDAQHRLDIRHEQDQQKIEFKKK